MIYPKVAILIFLLVSIINSILDLKSYHISIILNYTGLALCLIIYLIYSPELFLIKLSGGILLFLLFVLVRKMSHEGLGWGDIHYSFFCGFISGIPGFLYSSLLAALIGLLLFLILKIAKKGKSIKGIKIPFVPLMFLGTIGGLIILKYDILTL